MEFMLGDGPMLDGTWYNPKTGDSFTVRDTFFEDNSLIVMTTDGRRLDYNIISKYIKSADGQVPVMQKSTPAEPAVPQSVMNEVLPATSAAPQGFDDIMADDPAFMPASTATPRQEAKLPEKQQPVEDEDTMLVRRVLKRAAEPSIKFMIEWDNFPIRQIDMLDLMAVDLDKIADYYLSKIDLHDIEKAYKQAICDYIECPGNYKEHGIGETEEIKTEEPLKPAATPKPAVKKKPAKTANKTKKTK